MAYTALYRQWRPLTFDDVVGQKSVTETLKNEIDQGRIGHAYLFCGIRGTGKTSTARILSRAINCKNPQNGNPCNKCENCRGILDGSILDITEIDAASNNGVDNIRSLREEARFTGSVLSERVYIIDEVHMLSASAFNALLKILEEPPAHVHFILATTEAQKVPATILSRCQRFDFKRITAQDIEGQIKKILVASNTQYDDEAVHLIANAADGSMRDALSILDQCMSVGASVSYESISEFLGIADEEYINRLIRNIAESDIQGALSTVSEIVDSGKSIPPIANSLLKSLRNIMINKYSGKDDELSSLFTPQRLLQITETASQIPNLLRLSVDMRLTFELSLIRMLDPSYDISYEGVIARLAEVEEKLKNGVYVKSEKSGEEHMEQKPVKKAKIKEKKNSNQDLSSALQKVIEIFYNKFQLTLTSALEQAELVENDGKYTIMYSSKDVYDSFKQIILENADGIEKTLEEVTGSAKKISVDYVQNTSAKTTDSLSELLNKNKDIIN